MRKVYPLLGILGSVIYILTVFVGGVLRSDYSHLTNTISELTVSGAPNLILISILFTFYNICLVVFGFGAYLDTSLLENKKYRVATIMIGIIGILGALLFFFPQDPRGAAATLSGNIHIIIAGILSLLTILSVLLVGLGLGGMNDCKKFVWYSYFTTFIIIVSGGLAGFSVANNSIYGGLAERITIFAFMIWLMVFAYLILTRTSSECH